MDLTVAICTYRRAQILPQTLRSLTQVNRPPVQWDVLVVDNACDPQVSKIVDDFKDRLPIRYTQEPQTGIARARNRAVLETTAPVILFADDDVEFDPNWLCAMATATQTHSQCQFWGGRIIPAWSVPKPAWFDDHRCPMLGDSIVRYDLGPQPRPWQPASDPPFYTCNLALRTDAIRKAGMFDVTLGHQGSKRGGGEDSWMIRSISNAGGPGWYAADALLSHPVPPQRVTRTHARAFAWWQGRTGVEMLKREHADPAHPQGRIPKWLYRVAGQQMLAGLGRWAGGSLKRDQGLAFAGQFAALFNFSKLWHAATHR